MQSSSYATTGTHYLRKRDKDADKGTVDMARLAGKAGTQTWEGLMALFLKGGVRKKGR